MATSSCKTILTVVLSILSLASAILDGSTVSQCDYPGVVAIVNPNNDVIVCTGIHIGQVLYVPELCGSTMMNMVNSFDLMVVYGDGTKNVTLTSGLSGTLVDGIYQFPLPGPLETDCNSDAVLYDPATMVLDTTSCEVAGYGSSVQSAQVYDGVLNSAPLTKSTSAPCCDVILNALTSAEQGSLIDDTVTFNCVDSSGATCGVADLGSPVYCLTTGGQRVVVGLTASSPCVSGGTFLIHDLSSSDPLFKFGIAA